MRGGGGALVTAQVVEGVVGITDYDVWGNWHQQILVAEALRPLAPSHAAVEDVLEELLGQEIVDETDQFVDNLQTVKTST